MEDTRTPKQKYLKYPVGTNVTVTEGRYKGKSGIVVGKKDTFPRVKHEVCIGKRIYAFDQDQIKIIEWRL